MSDEAHQRIIELEWERERLQSDFAEMTRRAMRLEEEKAYLEQALEESQECVRLLRGELIQVRQDHDHPMNPVED